MNKKGRFALKQSHIMLKKLKQAKRNGLIDKKQADRLIEDLERSINIVKDEEEKKEKAT